MKIGLMGFEFRSANKGCEALVYSFLDIIKDLIEPNSVVYNFSDTELGHVPFSFSNMKFENVSPKIKDVKCNYLKKILECD